MFSALTPRSRADALAALGNEQLDVLVIGGGVTGAGVAVDAVTRGLRTGIVDMQDWAGGTSAWSSKLVHGGLRYLYNLDFTLVAEGLRERALLLTTTAPHLVQAQPFLWPLKRRVIERAYSAVGVGMYDAMAVAGFRGRAVPLQKHYSKRGALQLFPDIRPDKLIGAIRFYDARVDDARLVTALIRTAQSYGAHAASRTQMVDLIKDGPRVVGAEVVDLESGQRHRVYAKHVINATGVWTEDTEALAADEAKVQVLMSKGIHIVVPRNRIRGRAGIFLRTEKSVLFIIPWQRYWIIGTTDTPWSEEPLRPVATRPDVDYLLEHANGVLRSELTFEDIIGVYAGLRPLVQPSEDAASTKISRDHTVLEVAPGMTVITGGKLTSYRLMAEHAVDNAIGPERAKARPSVTARTPLVGASGLEAITAQAGRIGARHGWTGDRLQHLLGRYGTELAQISAAVQDDPGLGEPLAAAPAYLRAEVAWAITHEGALHLEDILQRRVRLFYESRDRGLGALPEIADIAAPLLGWDAETKAAEIDSYRALARAEEEALSTLADDDAVRARTQAPERVPLQPMGEQD
ncbi:glycerol-3-phosphate dehydrogenase/oxidase [Pseudactinotalea sp. Z1748]|uniref:glycerol-3-phosphate dehydrogenase/oxidase n=1 Tax=Pseudactinotalea sp. Z1748 TaxID=3413027 RepID=UPI003C7DB047